VLITPEGQRTAQTEPVIADGWVNLAVGVPGNGYRRCLALEVDRGSHKSRRFKQKIAARLAWSRGPYQQAFGTALLVIAYVATPGEGRTQQLATWTREELTRLGASDAEHELFVFTGQAPDSSPEALFFAPCWFDPFSDMRQALLKRLPA